MGREHRSERRTEDLTKDLLVNGGWTDGKPPKGNLLRQNEYRNYPELAEVFVQASKSGTGPGYPDFLCLEQETNRPVIVVETKASAAEIDQATAEATKVYGEACRRAGHEVIAVGVAGQEQTDFAISVRRHSGDSWVDLTYEGRPISWIPTPGDVALLTGRSELVELAPVVPSAEVLADRADSINRLLRESGVRDQYRPAYVGAMMLALWQSKGNVRKHAPEFVLHDINTACIRAFNAAGKPGLAESLRVDEANEKLANRAWIILAELEKLNVVTAAFDHDYLGHLYEAFFRYTGGNTIGQFFTPRHITRFMADLTGVNQNDVVIDPACGTGGFLISALHRVKDVGALTHAQTVQVVRDRLIGYEQEPMTAALCVANMILRGDGKSGIRPGDVFTAADYPSAACDVALMNPPFPHRATDAPPQRFVERALEALRNRGQLAVILPTSLIVKRAVGAWRAQLLRKHSLVGVVQLPDELFQPYASSTTSIVILEKGVPHTAARETVFIRVKHDGLMLKKKVRVPDLEHCTQLPAAADALLNRRSSPGFCGLAGLGTDLTKEWAVGAYIPTAPPERDELVQSMDELLRRLASFYVRYAKEIARQRAQIAAGHIPVRPYRNQLSAVRLNNAARLRRAAGTIGDQFDIFYGLKELHSREGMPAGEVLVVSPTEEYNGCYGWLNFPYVMEAPFVTVAQTGTIGEAFVQLEPCAVNDDCLVLLPRDGRRTAIAHLVIAAASIRLERWRFNYGRKLTPARIADFKLPNGAGFERWVQEQLSSWGQVIAGAVANYPQDAMPAPLR